MKKMNSKRGIKNPAFQNEVLHKAQLLVIKGGHCDEDDEESTAVVLDNGSGG